MRANHTQVVNKCQQEELAKDGPKLEICHKSGTCLKNFKYYLIHEKECFIIFKTRGAAERFRYDKTRLFECIK